MRTLSSDPLEGFLYASERSAWKMRGAEEK
jgi:hypothetical protein